MLFVHRSARADALVEALGELLASPLDDPVAAEVVSVPTRGVERWLTQRLSDRLGVCANVWFPSPADLVAGITAEVTGVPADDDPWRPERLTWVLVDVIDRMAADPALRPLVAHLDAATPPPMAGAASPRRRVATARHLAGLFSSYALQRPDLLARWAEGEAPPEEPASWQAHLWRLTRSAIAGADPVARNREVVDRVSGDPALAGLPSRLTLFGLTRLAPGHLDVLGALATRRDVHLMLLHPSAQLWEAVARLAPRDGRAPARADDPTSRAATNPLLRSWGRDVRELQLLVAARPHEVRHHVTPDDRSTLLGRVQADVRADRSPGERAVLDRDDDSLQVHSCHGRARQVEVLRDAVLHLLDRTPGLEPRDIIVMCPDIEAFAPYVHAAFGADVGGVGGGGGLRVRLADRSLRQTNPMLAVAASLLELASSRVTSSEVLDLASQPPVARRFRLDRADLATLESWVEGTAVRWGIDAGHRHPWSLGLADGTWESGLDRLLLGATMAADDCAVWSATVPYDDLPSSEVDLAGRVCEMVRRLSSAVDSLAGPQPLGRWVEALSGATRLVAEAPAAEPWQAVQLERVLTEVAAEALGGGDAPLALDEVRALLDRRLEGRPTRANFRTGDLTISTLHPMRSVPHRVVALLGLDDGVFPRHPEVDGDDLLGESPQVGQRDPRSEDRQLLLDALLAATEHLVITYSGRDERTNRRRPPAVPVAELLDLVDATCRTAGGRPGREAVVTDHPLQSFSPVNFRPGALAPGVPWSYDPVALDGALASSRQVGPAPWLAEPLAPLEEPVVALDDLVAMLVDPAKSFLRRRLGLWVGDRGRRGGDELLLELDALAKWQVGDRLVTAGLAGTSRHDAEAAERARGALPPGRLADPVLDDVRAKAGDLLDAARSLGALAPSTSLDVRVPLPGGRSVAGVVHGVRGDRIVVCTYSRLKATRRLETWVRLLAVTAARPELGASALLIGQGQGLKRVHTSELRAPVGDAGQLLARLVEIYDAGLCRPLPLSAATAAAWAKARPDDRVARAREQWEEGPAAERDQPAAVAVWGAGAPFGALREARGVGDAGFAELAESVWAPLLAGETSGAL